MNLRNRIKDNKGFSVVLLFSTLLWMLSVSLYLISNNNSKLEIISIESNRATEHYESVLNGIFSEFGRIEVFIDTVGLENITEDSFTDFVTSSNFEDIGFISLSVAPDGVIEFYYAEEYDTSLIGLDLLNDDRNFIRESVEYSIENEVIVINGPFILIQGGNGLVFRKPIYLDDEFSAIINLVVGYENLNAMFIESSSNVVELGIYDEDDKLIFGELEYSNDLDFYEKMNLANVDWNVGVQVTREYRLSQISTNIMTVLFSSSLYLLVLILGTNFHRNNKKMILNQEILIHYDNLTELPNRRLLINDIEAEIEKDDIFFLGFGDLDNFKNLNDILGHTVGDSYLRDISNRFHQLSNEKLKIYRWGGDEFIFLFKSENKNETISQLESIYDIFKEPIVIQDTNYNVSMSIGVVKFPEHGNNIDDLVKRADIVMYDIKSSKKNSYGFFEDKYLDNLQREVDFENKLYEYSIKDIEVYLQPIISLSNNEITGFEALARLFDREGQLVNTGEMIKVYERKGDIVKLDNYIAKKACEYFVSLKNESKKEYTISFNISPITLSNEYVEYLKFLLDEYDVDPQYLIIEIIETNGFKDINESIVLLNKLRDIGIKIAMDDFGMGYSSLSYITRLPLSLIKIDRYFIQNYEKNNFDKMIILTIKDISKSLNIEIVVEGIETKEQLEFVKNIGAHFYQGYYHSKPMSYEDIKKLIK